MKKFILFCLFFLILCINSDYCNAENNLHIHNENITNLEYKDIKETFYKGRVLSVLDETEEEFFEGYIDKIQKLEIQILSGDKRGEIIIIEHGGIIGMEQFYEFEKGDNIILFSWENYFEEEIFLINDYDRTSSLILVFIIFLIIIIYFGKKRGTGSIFGLIFSILILSIYIIPKILEGHNPILITLIGSIIIASISLFLSHGINKRTPIIWLSTIITLFLAIFLSVVAVNMVNLFGGGTEFSTIFQIEEFAHINLKGVLLAGIVIGTLGILDDVTATQTAVVWELKQANKKYKFKDLYKKSLIVGREHIASLVNTLAIAYVGASLPLFILFQANEHIPLWVKINSEPIAEEIIRTIIGSTALILAVPISSLLASYFIGKSKIK